MTDTDTLHEKGDHTEWNESFYFNFYDPDRDACAFMRIGLKPNRDEKSMFCFLLLPDGSVAGARAREACGDGRLSAGGLSFEKLEPERLWRLRFDGAMATLPDMRPVRADFDVSFGSLNRVFDYRECVSGEKELMAQSVASEHLEQFGRARGTITVGGRSYTVDGLGERDHSWGVREWTAPKMWIWLTAGFSDRCALNVTRLVVDRGEIDAGFVHLDGENRPLAAVAIDTAYGPDGGPGSLRMTLTDKQGRSYEVTAEVIKKVALPFEGGDGREAVMHETLARYTFDGMTGYGIAEYLIRRER